jgi:alpha-glucosidase
MALDALDTGFALRLGGQTILTHIAGAPCFSVGRGEPHVHSKLGHFDVSQEVIERIALNHVEVAGEIVHFAAARERLGCSKRRCRVMATMRRLH